MSEREFQGYVTIRQQSDHSMFTLRASLASSKVKHLPNGKQWLYT